MGVRVQSAAYNAAEYHTLLTAFKMCKVSLGRIEQEQASELDK